MMKKQENKESIYKNINLEWLPLPAFLVASNQTILAWNGKLHQIFPKISLGQDASTLMRDPSFLNCLKNVVGHKNPCECEISIKGRADHYFTLWINPIDTHNDQFIIHLKETTKEHEAERMRSTFVADVSHELRSPLTTMIATLETLKGRAGEDTATRSRFLEMTAAEAGRMHRIVDDLLTLSATEARKHIHPTDAVDLKLILENIVKTASERLSNKNMQVSVSLQSNLPPIVGDRDELIKVFHNLLDNAINYGEKNGSITVTLATGQNENTQNVSFNNRGNIIEPHHIPRLTERFYRADSSRSRHMGGTGLGLAIVKHILGRHNSSLRIESNEAEGTTFSATFTE